ncbi:MAG TPA: MFS transporter [Gammaproteobacteria bacterium]|jgi:MHS family proline/betaine transporter-like MFS transporter|nr:MFS transporter [Gammaproteobacteria bacterium]
MTSKIALTNNQKRLLFLSSLGGVLEYYDFIIYIFLAPYIEKLFFADNTTYIATLKTLAIFSVGYLIRPLGGIFFSHLGDRHGRKVVFLMTVLFMAIPSFGIGLLPTTINTTMMPILLLLFRIMQGLALGGEIPASITFVAEHVPRERRGLAISILFFGINAGLMLGSLITTIMSAILSEQQILAYGWRIPFILGGCFGFISIYLRRYLHETAAFKALKKDELQRVPMLTVFRDYFANVLQGVLIVSLGAVTVFFYLYWPQYLHQHMNYDLPAMMRLNTAATLVLNFMILAGGLLTDHFGFRKMLFVTAVTLGISSYPLFLLLQAGVFWAAVSYMTFTILFACIPSAYGSILADLFPTSLRYSGIAICYNIAYGFIGGLSPVICTLAIQLTGSVVAPAYYVILIAALTASACFLGRKTEKHTEPTLEFSAQLER